MVFSCIFEANFYGDCDAQSNFWLQIYNVHVKTHLMIYFFEFYRQSFKVRPMSDTLQARNAKSSAKSDFTNRCAVKSCTYTYELGSWKHHILPLLDKMLICVNLTFTREIYIYIYIYMYIYAHIHLCVPKTKGGNVEKSSLVFGEIALLVYVDILAWAGITFCVQFDVHVGLGGTARGLVFSRHFQVNRAWIWTKI